MSLLDRIKKLSTIKDTDVLSDSKVFNEKDIIDTGIPALNIALSGKIDGGLSPGLLSIAGPSRHFKSAFGLLMCRAYLKKYPDAVMLFYDSEFGTPKEYFSSLDIDLDRVVHVPITDIEQLKHDLTVQLDGITKGEHVIIFIDSIGNLASKKEAQDALDGHSAADMTRAKQLKSLWRIATPHFRLKNIPCIAIQHVYEELGLFPKQIMSGGSGGLLSSDNVWFIGRQQDKDGTDLVGYNFIVNIEKSRYVREKSKIPINVTFAGGINTCSGLLDIALETGHIVKPSNGWFSIKGREEKYRRGQIENNNEFWNDVFENTDFKKAIENRYRLSSNEITQKTKEVLAEND